MSNSIEEKVEDWCKKQLDKYYTKTESINEEIEKALKLAPSKNGGDGNNYPDIKCFIESESLRKIPVMIEVKGIKGDFGKFDKDGNVLNTDNNGDPNYSVIAKYAVNGAVHYGNAILTYTNTFKEVVAIGVNGYEQGKNFITEIGAYYISEANLFIPKKITDYSDLSFLKDENVEKFIKQIDELKLTDEEKEKQKLELEDDIEKKLKNINQKMHDDLGIVVGARVKLISGLIMAGLGVKGKVSGLKVEDLKGELGENSNDGKIIINKITDFLGERNLPKEKKEIILNELKNVFLYSKLEIPVNGESKLKTVYTSVKSDILPFLTKDLHNIDFTGRLFNVLNDWVDVPDGAENDVVLTPRYVTELMAKLCEVNKDSYVWDYATGSAGFLISSMNLMIEDAKKKIASPEEQNKAILKIKAEQLLGIEKLPDIYLLAVLNMILMGDGSSNIIHADSITQFEGKYEQGKHKGEKFPANVFLLNPPYSAPGKGFNFVEKALSEMSGGKAAVLIQENAGSTQGAGYTKKILEKNTLLASIHMSTDLFIGKSSVQTAIYVFEVGKPHDTEKLVKFIDFSNDGYTRQSRKKSSQSTNLKDTGNAKARYQELVNLVVRGKGKDNKNLNYFKDCYEEDYITLDGNDWTYSQHKKIDINPKKEDFEKVVKEYLAWRISDSIKNGESLGK
ncbi:MAG: N-6 DNA methylase [Treponema sp.]|nr:N-6 DNA methylase [Treponema sp.]